MIKIKPKRLGLKLTNKGNVSSNTTEHYFRQRIDCQKVLHVTKFSKKLSGFDGLEKKKPRTSFGQ